MVLTAKDVPSVISKGVVITGNINNGGNIEIEGSITGDLVADVVTIREGGNIKGNVKCKIFNIKGTFNGNANVEKINISDSAVVSGLLEYNFLSADYGANINCELKRISQQDQKKAMEILKNTEKKEEKK